jgi:hypothetical protein
MGKWMSRSTFLELGTIWRLVFSFALRPVYPGERVPGTH